MPHLKPQLVVFDLDNTLTESRMPLDEEMSNLLCDLLNETQVAIISGGAFEELKDRVISRLLCSERLGKLHILPTTGAELYSFRNDAWQKEYTYPFEKSKREEIMLELSRVVGLPKEELLNFVEDRGTQLTYSALGAHAAIEEKKKWDPNMEKRKEIVRKLTHRLSGVHMAIGGRTSIDFTAEGIDKAFGVGELMQYLKLKPENLIFIGDALVPGGNDIAVRSLGIKTMLTLGPDETKRFIRHILGRA